MHRQSNEKILYRGYRVTKTLLCGPGFSFLFFFFCHTTSKSPAVRRNMCVIVSPSACFIVHTTTSEELPLISRVSESPQHHHLLPAAFLNAFLLRAVLCPSDSGGFSTSSFIIPMGINGLYCLAIPTKGFVSQRKWKQPKWEWESEEFTLGDKETARQAKALESWIVHSTARRWRYLTCLEWALSPPLFSVDGSKHMEGIFRV